MRKIFAPAALLVFLMTLIVSATETWASTNPDYDRKITIVHTNDQHGIVDGEQYVKGLADKLKAAGEYVLTLNAGDALMGEPINVLTGGESVVKIINATGYDVFVPGNGEFISGLDPLLNATKLMAFPVIVSNYFDSNGNRIWPPYIIKETEGIRIGIFGLTATSENPYKLAEGCVAELKDQGCSVIIAVVHLGIGANYHPSSTDLAVHVPGIDLVVDGHSHTALEKGILTGDTLIVQAGDKLEYIGVAELYIKDGRVVDRKASLMDRKTYTSTITPDAVVESLIAEELADINKITSTVIGKASNSLDGERQSIRTSETNLGDMVADAMRWKTKSDLAMVPGAAIRASIPAGEITIGSALSALPMGAIVTVVEAPGRFVWDILENAAQFYPDLNPGFLQISGVSYSFNPDGKPGSRVTEVMTGNGKPIDPEARYIIAMPDAMVRDMQPHDYGEILIGEDGDYSSVFIEYVKSDVPIPENPAGRIRMIP